MADEFMRFLAAWALVHETADEGWKAAAERGRSAEPGSMEAGTQAFVDGFSAMIADEKERLKAEIAAGRVEAPERSEDLVRLMDELRFELGELRGRIETLQASVDALSRGTGVEAVPPEGSE